MRRLLCAFLAFIFCTAALSAECPIGTTPAQYIQLEYLESTGTQYIDTGIPAINYDSIRFLSRAGVTESNTLGILFGTFSYYDGTYLGSVNNKWALQETVSIDVSSKEMTDLDFTTYNIKQGKQNSKLVIDGTTYTYARSSRPATTSINILLFGTKADTPDLINPIKAKLSNTKIYDNANDHLLLDFVPAMRLGDGKPGMYDKVSGNFFTNAGTGEFIMGPPTGKAIMDAEGVTICTPCPPNTYKDFVGDGECTPCPDTLISPSGSKSASECGRVLHIGDKIYHMKSVKQTSPALHIRDENGNVWYGNLYSEQE